jgi:hypothetical protein
MPSAMVLASCVSTARRARRESRIAGAPEAQTPTTFVPEDACLIQVPIPPSNAPLPNGMTTVAMDSGHWHSSTAIEPAPSVMAGSRPSSTKNDPSVRA